MSRNSLWATPAMLPMDRQLQRTHSKIYCSGRPYL
jgi:hypothetical protein